MPWEFEQLAEYVGFSLIDEIGVYKKGITKALKQQLPRELKQAVSFIWLYMSQI